MSGTLQSGGGLWLNLAIFLLAFFGIRLVFRTVTFFTRLLGLAVLLGACYLVYRYWAVL